MRGDGSTADGALFLTFHPREDAVLTEGMGTVQSGSLKVSTLETQLTSLFLCVVHGGPYMQIHIDIEY